MAITLPNKKQKGKHFISTKRPNLDYDKPEYKETKVAFADETHGVHGEKVERFSKLKKLLQKKTV